MPKGLLLYIIFVNYGAVPTGSHREGLTTDNYERENFVSPSSGIELTSRSRGLNQLTANKVLY